MQRVPTVRFKRCLPIVLLLILLAGINTGCRSEAGSAGNHELEMAPLAEMPTDVQASPVTVQQAYQFAVANPEVLEQIPCYCGCGSMGHTSNFACYVSERNAEGEITFDSHALGCSICVDITQDAMRLLKQGKTTAEIRSFVDQTYSQFGPSNMP